MRLHIVLLFAAMLPILPAQAADPCPATAPGVEWAAGCFEADGDGRRVRPQYLKRLRMHVRGHATIMISRPRELVAVNRQGKVVVPGIRHTGDFDYPDAERGIGRFELRPATSGSKAARKCGYFDSRDFRIVIPAEYAQCKAFAGGEAIACKDCISLCVELECQHSVLLDGEGVALGPDGSIRRHFRLPDRKTYCANTGSEAGEAGARRGSSPQCIPTTENPFR